MRMGRGHTDAQETLGRVEDARSAPGSAARAAPVVRDRTNGAARGHHASGLEASPATHDEPEQARRLEARCSERGHPPSSTVDTCPCGQVRYD